MVHTSVQSKGIFLMVGSVFCFAIVNAIAKSHPHIPVHELVLFRSIVSFVFAAAYVKSKGISFWGNNKFWLIMRGLMGLIALVLFFSTIMNMPLASASTIQYLSPVFTVLIATQLNDQKVRPIQWLFFLIAFVGAVMIKGFDTRVSTTWLLVGITSAFFAGLAYNSIIKSKGTDHAMTIVLYNPMVAIPITGMWCFFDYVQPQGMEWLWMLIMGIFAHTAQYLMTLALHSDVASKITPWNYFGAIFALIIGYFFFDEEIAWLSVFGMLLVVTGVILNARVKR
jgi:drug/metabolite transporter (DMT)-like permease